MYVHWVRDLKEFRRIIQNADAEYVATLKKVITAAKTLHARICLLAPQTPAEQFTEDAKAKVKALAYGPAYVSYITKLKLPVPAPVRNDKPVQ